MFVGSGCSTRRTPQTRSYSFPVTTNLVLSALRQLMIDAMSSRKESEWEVVPKLIRQQHIWPVLSTREIPQFSVCLHVASFDLQILEPPTGWCKSRHLFNIYPY